MQDVGRLVTIAGIVLVIVGVLLWAGAPLAWLGRLPGDIRIERPGFRVYLPLATCLVLSVVVSLVLWLLGRWR